MWSISYSNFLIVAIKQLLCFDWKAVVNFCFHFIYFAAFIHTCTFSCQVIVTQAKLLYSISFLGLFKKSYKIEICEVQVQCDQRAEKDNMLTENSSTFPGIHTRFPFFLRSTETHKTISVHGDSVPAATMRSLKSRARHNLANISPRLWRYSLAREHTRAQIPLLLFLFKGSSSIVCLHLSNLLTLIIALGSECLNHPASLHIM